MLILYSEESFNVVSTPLSSKNPAPQDPFFKGLSLFSMLKKPVICAGIKTETLIIKNMEVINNKFVHSSKLYSSSQTSSHHSFSGLTPGTSIAICVNSESLLAPCQCFTFGGIDTTSPGFNF